MNRSVFWISLGNRKQFHVVKASKQTIPASLPAPYLGIHVERCQRYHAKNESRSPCFLKGSDRFPFLPFCFCKALLSWFLVLRSILNSYLCFTVLDLKKKKSTYVVFNMESQCQLGSAGPSLIWRMYRKHWHLRQQPMLYLMIHSKSWDMLWLWCTSILRIIICALSCLASAGFDGIHMGV